MKAEKLSLDEISVNLIVSTSIVACESASVRSIAKLFPLLAHASWVAKVFTRQ